MDYGYSFNSKKVSAGPTFFNLRLMCVCVGRAIRRHIEFSRGAEGSNGDNWLLDDLKSQAKQEAKVGSALGSQRDTERQENMDFTYNFKDELKITTRPSKLRKATDG